MKHVYRSAIVFVLLLLIGISVVMSQGDTCPDIVQTALATVDAYCSEMGRNQACYGNPTLKAQSRPNIEPLEFNSPGDIVDVTTLQSLVLSPMDEAIGEWGISLMKLQANLPDALPGQNVTFLLFGDVVVKNAPVISITATTNLNIRSGPTTDNPIVDLLAEGETANADGRNQAGDWLHIQTQNNVTGWIYAPLVNTADDTFTLPAQDTIEADPNMEQPASLQSFYFRTGIGDAPCASAPDSGILVQTPSGVEEIHFQVNGVDIRMASTAYLTAQPEAEMTFTLLEGNAEVAAFGESQEVTTGRQVIVPMDENLEPAGPPTFGLCDTSRIKTLPLDTLERRVRLLSCQDVIEISFGYNSMAGVGKPTGGVPYCGQITHPIVKSDLPPGRYVAKMVKGREDGNPACTTALAGHYDYIQQRNPNAVFPDTGYNGGNTDVEPTGISSWKIRTDIWVGESPSKGVRYRLEGVNNRLEFNLQEGQSIWFYWEDEWVEDNVGGATVELRHVASDND